MAGHITYRDDPGEKPATVMERLDAWATDVGFYETGRSLATLDNYRRCSIAWAPHARKNAAWAAHRDLCHHPDRWNVLSDGMSIPEVRRLLGRKSIPQTSIYLPGADRIVAAIQADPKGVARKALDSPATLRAQIATFRDPANLEELLSDPHIEKLLTKSTKIRSRLLRVLASYLWDSEPAKEMSAA
jgi:hypothetical protein